MIARFASASLLAACCALLVSCATQGVSPVNPAVNAKLQSVGRNRAAVVVYRESNFMGAALRPTVMLNGQDFVNVGNGRVFVGAFQPGHYVFQMDDRNSGTEVDLTPGKAIYMKVDIVPGVWKGGGRLTQMAPEQGSFEAQRLQLLEPKEIEIAAYR
jgi:hypothetical protein